MKKFTDDPNETPRAAAREPHPPSQHLLGIYLLRSLSAESLNREDP
jgi:hypothetical protein